MSGVPKHELEARQRWAAESILNSEALTDDLADAEAARLLAWATERAEVLAAETAALQPAEAETMLDERLTALRKLVRGINRLAGESQPAGPAQLQSRLARLAETAQSLGLGAPAERAVADYIREHDKLAAGARLERLLSLFGEARPGPQEGPTAGRTR